MVSIPARAVLIPDAAGSIPHEMGWLPAPNGLHTQRRGIHPERRGIDTGVSSNDPAPSGSDPAAPGRYLVVFGIGICAAGIDVEGSSFYPASMAHLTLLPGISQRCKPEVPDALPQGIRLETGCEVRH
jgi:hypothetical protein